MFLPVVLGSTPSSSYATPPATPDYTFSIREADAEGTTHYAPDYRPPQLGPEYTSNPPTYGPNDTYVQDEVIIRFRPDVPPAQQNALMQAHGMRFGRRIYGEKAFVAKVPPHAALTVANALSHNPMLDVAGVNPILEFAADPYDPNDEYAPEQEHLGMLGGKEWLNQINARAGWGLGHGLNQVSLVAILDIEVDRTHPDIVDKYRPENWQTFYSPIEQPMFSGHGTHVAGLATASTDNNIGVAGTGFSAWPMSLAISPGAPNAPDVSQFDAAISAIYWGADHGASVINMSFGCRPNVEPNCTTRHRVISLLKTAVDTAYARGITIVAAAGNYGQNVPFYPAAFGQVSGDPWMPNEKLVIAVGGTWREHRDPYSNFGEWLDFGAPLKQDDGLGLLSTVPYTFDPSGYYRMDGTSMSTPQVAGFASLLTSLGYQNAQVWDFMKAGAADLPCDPEGEPCPPGYDIYTGWGRIDMGRSMELAHRTTPGMAIVPDEGYPGIQWFNFQASGFADEVDEVRVCWTPPGGRTYCHPDLQPIDDYGVAGVGIQVSQNAPFGTWAASMCEVGGQFRCTSSTFTVLNDPD